MISWPRTISVGRRLLWTAPVHTTVEPVVGNGLVFVVEPDFLVALRVEDGVVAWKVPFAETLAVPPAFAGEWLVAATTTGDIAAHRASEGALVWRQHLNAPAHARPEIVGTRIFVPTSDAHVIALNSNSGVPLWDRRLGKPGNEILATDERLYLGSEDRYFYCLNAMTGVVEWRWTTGANVIGRPVVDEQTGVLRLARQCPARAQCLERRPAMEELVARSSVDGAGQMVSDPCRRRNHAWPQGVQREQRQVGGPDRPRRASCQRPLTCSPTHRRRFRSCWP